MEKALELAILKYVNEVEKILPHGWGELPVGEAYHNLWREFNHARGVPTFEEYVGQEMPKFKKAFLEFTSNM